MKKTKGEEARDAAAAYDQRLVPWLFDHWADPLIDLAPLQPFERVLDLACGTGLITRHLLLRLDSHGRVDGVDTDPAMLAHAAQTMSDARVTWHESVAEQLGFGDDSFDRVTCHQGLQFFADPDAALSGIRRVLRGGGALTLAVWGPIADNPWPAALAEAARRTVGDEVGDAMTTVSRLGDPALVDTMLRRAGFRDVNVEVRVERADHPDVTEAVEGQLAALPDATSISDLDDRGRRALLDTMISALGDHVRPDGGVSVPSSVVMAAATAPG